MHGWNPLVRQRLLILGVAAGVLLVGLVSGLVATIPRALCEVFRCP